MQKRSKHDLIPEKANVILHLILIAFVIIGARLWYLSVIQYEEKFEQSKRPQRKTVIESAKRATIRDRFNIPLAYNKIAYSAGVSYAPIRQVPSIAFEEDETGKKVKKFKRKEYIKNLSHLLAEELHLDEKRVEDLIYSKAALYFNLPYILKQDISEKEYYRLRMLEKDWPGLVVQTHSKREYPKGFSAADIVGYMGAISLEQYEKIILEKKALEDYLVKWENGEDPPFPVGYESLSAIRNRYKDLEALAYTAQDYVGKTGIEALFEQHLRGFQGKKTFYTDSKGNLLKELPGARPPLQGKRILLSISSELQEYAESLLAQNERLRIARSTGHGKKVKNQKQPWIKGGAIVVMDPNTGEVLTLATYPRFNPNDFLKKDQKKINRWFENEAHMADLWNEVTPLARELYNEKFYEEKKWLTWPVFLEFLLPKDHPITLWFQEHDSLKEVIAISKVPVESLDFVPTPYTKQLFRDCCQLAVDSNRFSPDLIASVGDQSITVHKAAGAAYFAIKNAVKGITEGLFHDVIFSEWREAHEKQYLKGKREEEKLAKTYPRPYLDYLDEKERELFASFWERVETDFCLLLLGEATYKKNNCFSTHFKLLNEELAAGAHPALPWRSAYDKLKKALQGVPKEFIKEYLASLRSYQDLTRPLVGKYRSLRNGSSSQLEKHLASSIYPTYGFGHGRSFAYRQASTQGSIFKMVTAHEALLQTNEEALKSGRGIKNPNPLDIVDDIFKIGTHTYVGYHDSGKPISQVYKGGRIPRSHCARMGKMDLLHAIEISSNPYFSLLAGDVLKNPNDLAAAAERFGFGKKTGIELPGEIPGSIPKDLETNRTGLYATAIGQHSLVVTPLQTALFLSSLANGGELLKPQIVKYLIGSFRYQDDEWLFSDAEKDLLALGIDFPLFRTDPLQRKPHVEKTTKTITSKVEMPPSLRQLLLEGMRRVVLKTHQDSLGALSRLYTNHPEAISDYVDFKHQIVGKTSTSESMERIDMDEEEGINLYTHVWFGGISFENDIKNKFENPELVIVIYLRFGSFGKEAAPLAAQIVHKWREIKASHQKS